MIVIALGANLDSVVGSPVKTISSALEALSKRSIRIVNVSPFYATPAWPDASDPSFVNAIARIETDFAPGHLMKLLHETETAFGRTRSVKNAPRTLDLDLIDYDGRVEEGPPVLPHPRLSDRAFVLVPLADVAPGWRHPTLNLTVEQLIAALPLAARKEIKPASV